MTLYTIGFTKKNAEQFFTLLRKAQVRSVLDIRLNNMSQLAGFAKRDDLRFFLKELCGATYRHVPECSPTEALLEDYKKKGGDWAAYERAFIPLIQSRRIEILFAPEQLDHACLLCSEATPEQCHRRLVGEYLKRHCPEILIDHL